MSITTVAEYIETEAISIRIAELGVDYGQGFAIGRPIPLEDLLTELPLPSDPAPEPPVYIEDTGPVDILAEALAADEVTAEREAPADDVSWYSPPGKA
jgi:predicted signal transduction protein with EAL and GGDEF domain